MKTVFLTTVMLCLIYGCGKSSDGTQQSIVTNPSQSTIREITGEFDQGSEYKILRASGVALVACHGYVNGKPVTFQREIACEEPFTHPSAFAKFTTRESDSRVVRLTNLSHENFSRRYSFNPALGESSEVNLLLGSLVQKPLLRNGINNILFEMLRNDGSVESHGDMVISVETIIKTCPRIFMDSYDLTDCSYNNKPTLCSRYFHESRCVQ